MDRNGSSATTGRRPEYVLIMRRLPERRMLPFLLETRQVTHEMMGELAEILAQIPYASRADHICPILPAIRRRWRRSGRKFSPKSSRVLEPPSRPRPLRRLRDSARDLSTAPRSTHSASARGLDSGRAWRSPLRAVCFAPEGIQIFDCIEFDAEICGSAI